MRNKKIKIVDESSREYLIKTGINPHFWRTVVRPYLLKRSKYKCENLKCKYRDKGLRLEIHHLSYKIQTKNTLRVLCSKCHKEWHKRYGSVF